VVGVAVVLFKGVLVRSAAGLLTLGDRYAPGSMTPHARRDRHALLILLCTALFFIALGLFAEFL
jgi:hypothetical protein